MNINQTQPFIVTTPSNSEQQGYQSITLPADDMARCTYLPIFSVKPSAAAATTTSARDHLLLANVPKSQLGSNEVRRREKAMLTTWTQESTSVNYDRNDNAGYPFALSSDDAKELSKRLEVNETLIKCNADRLRSICYTLIGVYELFQTNVLERKETNLTNPTLDSKQMSLLLEFFLQMDVDTFYMKTCRFRGAEPCSSLQSLFYNEDIPQTRNRMVPCYKNECDYCQAMNNQSPTATPLTTIEFETSSQHRFVNGYKTYLNCPAICSTTNIVYVMTCPCGDYEFIDSTSGTLVDALNYHRMLSNQMIHSYLTGSALYHQIMTTSERNEHQILKQMRLYEHSAHCAVALQRFLDLNPRYACFIPMSMDEAQQEDNLYESTIRATRSENISVAPMHTMAHQHVAGYLSRVPLSVTQRTFSRVQLHEQRLFFDRFIHSNVNQYPYVEMDFYQMKILAVLPMDESNVLRYLIETLFIIHAEPKLNMICPIGIDPQQRHGLPYDQQWQSQMKRSTPRNMEYILSIIEMIKELNRRPADPLDE